MSELRLLWDPAKGHADIALVDRQLDLSEALETWVIVSLFTDRLAEESDPVIAAPDGTKDRRGWWGDTLLGLDRPNDRIGSRLWLLERAKSDRNTPKLAEGYIREALQWLIDDGIASAIAIDCRFMTAVGETPTAALRADITIEHRSGRHLSYRYDWAWKELGN